LALGASIAVHAVLLTVRFVDPESFNRVFKDTPLEVILVNSKSNEKSDNATAIAQTALAGGGEASNGRATSPLPPALINDLGETQEDEIAHKLQPLQEQQTLLLSQLKDRVLALAPRDTRQATLQAEDANREEKRRQLVKLLAEIERRIQTENAKPKKRYVSPSTREEAAAVYIDAMSHAIEDRGTSNFPQSGGKKLYGELLMVLTINFDGLVLDTEIHQGSGNATLDRRASSIARASGPFGTFTPAMRRKYDQMVIVYRFKFSRDQTLETKVLGTTP
jgi:protein TonB